MREKKQYLKRNFGNSLKATCLPVTYFQWSKHIHKQDFSASVKDTEMGGKYE